MNSHLLDNVIRYRDGEQASYEVTATEITNHYLNISGP
jgi:hypothetical protein